MQSNGNYSYNLYVNIDNDLCYDDKNKLASTIYNIINNKVIIKNTLNIDIPITWAVSNENDLLNYFTDVQGIFSDKAIYEHTKILLDDIKKTININKFNFIIRKPLTKKIFLL